MHVKDAVSAAGELVEEILLSQPQQIFAPQTEAGLLVAGLQYKKGHRLS